MTRNYTVAEAVESWRGVIGCKGQIRAAKVFSRRLAVSKGGEAAGLVAVGHASGLLYLICDVTEDVDHPTFRFHSPKENAFPIRAALARGEMPDAADPCVSLCLAPGEWSSLRFIRVTDDAMPDAYVAADAYPMGLHVTSPEAAREMLERAMSEASEA